MIQENILKNDIVDDVFENFSNPQAQFAASLEGIKSFSKEEKKKLYKYFIETFIEAVDINHNKNSRYSNLGLVIRQADKSSLDNHHHFFYLYTINLAIKHNYVGVLNHLLLKKTFKKNADSLVAIESLLFQGIYKNNPVLIKDTINQFFEKEKSNFHKIKSFREKIIDGVENSLENEQEQFYFRMHSLLYQACVCLLKAGHIESFDNIIQNKIGSVFLNSKDSIEKIFVTFMAEFKQINNDIFSKNLVYLLSSSHLEYQPNIHYQNDVLIKYACQEGLLDFVQFLLSSDKLKEHANVYEDNCSAFKKAYNNKHKKVLDYLIYDYKINKTEAINDFIFRKFVDTSDLAYMFKKRDMELLTSTLENKLTISHISNKRNKI